MPSTRLYSALGLLIALTATMGSLYFSEIRYFYPCLLCWYQRILMYPLVLVSLVALFKKEPQPGAYVLPLAIPGLLIALYHYSLQNGLFAADACSDITCSARYINYWGFITIPFLSLIAFSLLTLIFTVSIFKKR